MHVFQQAKETFLLVKDPMIGGLNNQLMTFVAYGEIEAKANRTLVLPQFLGKIPKGNVRVPVEFEYVFKLEQGYEGSYVVIFTNQGFPSQLIKLHKVPSGTLIQPNFPTFKLHKDNVSNDIEIATLPSDYPAMFLSQSKQSVRQ